jgi:hypothetical protein
VISANNWNADFINEIDQAKAARENGNEGMARVCARRAVGILMGEYLARRGYGNQSASAYDRIIRFISLPDTEEQLKDICGHFLMKVDLDRSLPSNIDLIAEAHWLEETLFPDEV